MQFHMPGFRGKVGDVWLSVLRRSGGSHSFVPLRRKALSAQASQLRDSRAPAFFPAGTVSRSVLSLSTRARNTGVSRASDARRSRGLSVSAIAGAHLLRPLKPPIGRPGMSEAGRGVVLSSVVPVRSDISSFRYSDAATKSVAFSDTKLRRRSGSISYGHLQRMGARETPSVSTDRGGLTGYAGVGLRAHARRFVGVMPLSPASGTGPKGSSFGAVARQLPPPVIRLPSGPQERGISAMRIPVAKDRDLAVLPPFSLPGAKGSSVGNGAGRTGNLQHEEGWVAAERSSQRDRQYLPILTSMSRTLSMRSYGAMIDEIATPQYPNMSIGLM